MKIKNSRQNKKKILRTFIGSVLSSHKSEFISEVNRLSVIILFAMSVCDKLTIARSQNKEAEVGKTSMYNSFSIVFWKIYNTKEEF